MIDLLFAAALLQAAPDPCNAAVLPDPAPANCPHWRLMRHDEEGDGFVDPDSVRRDGATVEITLRTVFAREILNGARTLDARVRLDCARRTRMITHISAYDVAGVRLFDEPVSSDPPATAPENSPYGAVLGEYCPRRG